MEAIFSWYSSGKWIEDIVQLPETLVSVSLRIAKFVLQHLQATPALSYDVEDASKKALKDVIRLRRTIANFDSFILAQPALKSAVVAHLQKYSPQFVQKPIKQYVPNLTDTVFERWRKVNDEKVDLEFTWNERTAFIKRHPRLIKCMLEHMRAASEH